MAKDWYSPGEVYFTYKTALWLIQNLGTLQDGYWPPEASNYIDMPSRKTASRKASFATPIEYAAEITQRLEKCRLDGLILEAIECWGKSEASLSKYLRMSERSIGKRARRALSYVASGPARRWHDTKKRGAETYEQFKKRKKKGDSDDTP